MYRAKKLSDGFDYGVKILKKSLIVEEADLISLFKEIKILTHGYLKLVGCLPKATLVTLPSRITIFVVDLSTTSLSVFM